MKAKKDILGHLKELELSDLFEEDSVSETYKQTDEIKVSSDSKEDTNSASDEIQLKDESKDTVP